MRKIVAPGSGRHVVIVRRGGGRKVVVIRRRKGVFCAHTQAN